MLAARCRPCIPGSLPKGTPLEEGVRADPAKFKKAVKVADKLGERIARTTDKIMEMRQDIDGKQVGATARPAPLTTCTISLVGKHDGTKPDQGSSDHFILCGRPYGVGAQGLHRALASPNRVNV